MFVSIVMAMVDVYPTMPGFPSPAAMRFRVPALEIVVNLSIAVLGSALALWTLSRILPRTSIYGKLMSQSASGESTVVAQEEWQARWLGETGVTLSVLHPGGKAQFDQEILDVISQGDMIPRGRRIKIIGYSGKEAIVEMAD